MDGRWRGQFAVGSRSPGPCPAEQRRGAGLRGCTRVRISGVQWGSPHTPTGCASVGHPSGPLVVPTRVSQSRTPEKLHLYSSPNYPPNWQLSAWDDAGGCGWPCSAKPQQPCPSRRGSGGPGTLPGLGDHEAGAPLAPRRPPPLLRLERFQSRGAASLASALARRSSCSCSSSSCSSSFSPCPQRPLPQSAPPLPPSPSSPAIPANFPKLSRRRRAPRQPPGPLQTAGCERGCALYPVPAPLARSGEKRTMLGAGDRGAPRARWLGTGLLGKAAPARFLLLPLPPSSPISPQSRGHFEEQCLGRGEGFGAGLLA